MICFFSFLLYSTEAAASFDQKGANWNYRCLLAGEVFSARRTSSELEQERLDQIGCIIDCVSFHSFLSNIQVSIQHRNNCCERFRISKREKKEIQKNSDAQHEQEIVWRLLCGSRKLANSTLLL
jgi:hypothetical protein